MGPPPAWERAGWSGRWPCASLQTGFLVRFQTRHGLGAMPAFGEDEIPSGDLDDVTAYLKALRRNG